MMLVLSFFIPAITLLALHWAPWNKALGRELPRLVSYAIGATIIIGVPTLLQHFLTPTYGELLFSFWAALAGAGLATATGWTIDALIELAHRNADDSDRYGSKN